MDTLRRDSFELASGSTLRISLVDPDDHRRAAISFWLSSANIHVQPFENADELFSTPRPNGLVLIADEGNQVASLLSHPVSADFTIPFIAYATEVGVNQVVQAMRRGAIDYLLWPSGKEDMSAAIAAASGRRQTMEWPRRQSVVATSQPHALTKRETEVLHSLRDGLTSRQVAERLDISVRTVDIYCGNIRRKFGVRRIADAITMYNAASDGSAGEAKLLRAAPAKSSGPGTWGAAKSGELGDVLEGMERKAGAQARLARLTKRETEVLAYVASGLSNWQIADQLKISRRTVETHRYNLLDKMEMKNMALAIRLAAEGGLV